MNFIYFIVIFFGTTSSGEDNCDIVLEGCKFIRDAMERFLPPLSPNVLESVNITYHHNEDYMNLIINRSIAMGALNCIDSFCLPDKKVNLSTCHTGLIPLYSDENLCKEISHVYSSTSFPSGNLPAFWDVPGSQLIKSQMYDDEFEAEDICNNLHKFNAIEKINRKNNDYIHTFNESAQFVIAAYSERIRLGSLFSMCVRSLSNRAASFFGVAPVITNNGTWLVGGLKGFRCDTCSFKK